MEKNRRGTVWQGAFWLSIGSFISKLIGAVYRIFLPRVLGDYGVGLFQMAYPLYAVLLAISINGIPTALSKQTAEKISQGDAAGAEALGAWAQVVLGTVGICLAILMEISAPLIARGLFSEPAATLSIRALAPALGFVALEASFRGYFQGHQEMIPTAMSQILEQVVRVAVMFPMALVLLPQGVVSAAAGATLGAPVGAGIGVTYLIWRRVHHQPRFRLPRPIPVKDLGRLFLVALPMSLSGLLFPLMLLADSMFVPLRLTATGLTMEQATAQFGRLSGEAMPLVNLTMVVGAALAVSLVPAVARSIARGQREEAGRRVAVAMHLVWLIGLPMSGGLIVLARPLTHLLYGGSGASGALEVLAVGATVLAIQQILGSSLQAAGHGWIPVKNLILGAVVKFGLTWWLTVIPGLGIRGAAIGTVAAGILTAYMNWHDWTKIVPNHGGLVSGAWWPLAGTVLMVMGIQTWIRIGGGMPEIWVTSAAILLGVLVYGVLMLGAGELSSLQALWNDR